MRTCRRSARPRNPSFRVVTEVERLRAVIRLCGELDLATLPRLQRAVGHALRADATVIVVDLRDLDFADAVGLRGIEVLARELAVVGRRLTVMNVSERMMRLVDMVGAHGLSITP